VNIGKMLCNEPQVFRVLNPRQGDVGQAVNIVIPEGAVRKGAFLAYGLPLLMLLIGAFVGVGVAGDPGAIVGALGGLVVAFPAVRLVQSGSAASSEFQPYIDVGVSRK
jgi:sigma-E factor negative regulatory protein RseC